MATLLYARAVEYAGLTPDQASEMTPYDLQLVIEAGFRRIERERENLAWQTAHVLSAVLRKQVTMDDLLGPRWTHQRMLRERGREE